jgi:hypothetical protein
MVLRAVCTLVQKDVGLISLYTRTHTQSTRTHRGPPAAKQALMLLVCVHINRACGQGLLV